jgi:signal peptidase II
VTTGCFADLLTKHWVFAWRGLPTESGSSEWWLWEPYFGIQTALNTGALFGMWSGQGSLFAALSIVAIIAILCWLFLAGAAHDRRLILALGCVMGGILGNLYDRLGFWAGPSVNSEMRSAVRDWILIRYGSFTWPNFNIADSLLVCGATMLFWHAMRERSADQLAIDPSRAAP